MSIKKILRYVLALLLIIGLYFSDVQPAFAQEIAPGDQVTFTQLQVADISLRGPLGSDSIRFTLPANWELTSGAELHLNLHVFAGDAANSLPGSVTPVSGFLSLRVNNTWVQTVTLDHAGDYSLVIQIPASVWLTSPRNVRQIIRFSLESSQSCDMLMAALARGIYTGLDVLINPTSFLVLPHNAGADIPLDFRLFPYPLYQKSFVPDKVVLIMPQQPTETELQAVMTTASAMGLLTQKLLAMTYVTVDKLDPAVLNDSNAIFVGKPGDFSLAQPAKWPVTADGGKFSSQQITDSDGVLQLAISPRNKANTWLMVSGNTDAGVLKAAQALGGVIRPNTRTDLAIVADVKPQSKALTAPDVTLADLGYTDQTFVGYDSFNFLYWVDVPLDYVVSNGAYFDLVYSNAALLNFDESSLTLNINDQFIGGLRFSDRTTNTTHFRFNIPSSSFKSGSNLISFNVTNKGANPCVSNNDVWVSIWSTSLLHAPIEPVAPDVRSDYLFDSYPKQVFPFYSNTTIVLPKDDPNSWNAAARVAFNMGGYRRGSLINPGLVFPENLTTAIRNNNDLLLVGKASTLPVLQDLTAGLPAPFDAGSDIATERDASVSFRVSPNNPMGYLEIFNSPWNPRRVVLLVAGNSPDGLASASTALTDTDRIIYPDLFGNFALVEGLQLNSRLVVVDQKALVQPTPTPQAPQAANAAPQTDLININLPLVGVILAVGVLVLGGIFWFVRWRMSKRKPWEQQ